MQEKFNTFILHVKNKSGEHEQALLRIFFAFLIFVYLYIQSKVESNSSTTVLLFSADWFIFSIALTLYILVSGVPSRNRQIASMLADIGAVTYGMYLTQEGGVVFYGVYLWVIVGNGLRNGIQSLTLAYVFSLVGFTTVILFNSYWLSHLQLAAGLMIPLALIPLYIMKLRNQLNRATEEAKEASLAKSHFLAHMSHEMRTPLNGIIGANDLLIASSLNAEQRDLALTLENSSRILRQMVDNVLDISKIESGKLDSEKVDFDLHELVNNIIVMFHTQAQEKGLELAVRFTPDTPYALHGDAQHLLQVIVNLVGNALKFTHTGSVGVHISTVHQDRRLAAVKFEVIDTGIGIAPEVQQSIFERFTQADANIALKYGGTGLGTTISRDLVQLMGGVIGLNSTPGKGSVFWFDLPLEKQMQPRSVVAPVSLAQLRVLSIGLDQPERKALANYLASWDVVYEHDESLPRLLARLTQLQKQQKTGVVVMCTPQHLGMSHETFARQISEHIPAHKIALIALETDAQRAVGEHTLRAGYSSVLRFPLDKTLLFNALHSIVAPRALSGVISFKEHYERSQINKSGMRILLADDNATNRKIIAKILEHGGHQVELAEDGEEALDALENQRFDLMILDMSMPNMGGIEVAKIHRATMHYAPTPIIILTANATVAALRECEEAEVDAYLTKPVNALTLLDHVARLTAAHSVAPVTPVSVLSDVMQARAVDDEAAQLLNENTLYQLELLGGGQGDFLADVINGFITETEKLLLTMQSALDKKEYANFKDLAHVLEGSAGNVGGNALHLLCREMMRCSHEKLQHQGGELLAQVQICFASTCLALMQHLEVTARVAL